MSRLYLSFYFSIAVVMFLLLVLTGCKSGKVAEARYSVIEKDGRFELRDYEPQIIAETVVNTDFEDAGDEAFKRLFDYISGNNKLAEKIAMTVPVSQKSPGEKISMTTPVGQREQGGRWVVSFMMPSSYTMDTIPLPKDSRVTLRQIPARRMCAVKYSGRWTLDNYQKYKTELEDWMRRRKLEPVGGVIWARYNPPWTLWFLRRNEVLYPVRKAKSIENR